MPSIPPAWRIPTWAPEERIDPGLTERMVRLSIGVEHPEDLIADLEQALEAV